MFALVKEMLYRQGLTCSFPYFAVLYRSSLSSLLLLEEQYEMPGECFRLSSDGAASTER